MEVTMDDCIIGCAQIRARKEHICDYCNEGIVIGVLYERWVSFGDDVQTMRAHIVCEATAQWAHDGAERWECCLDAVLEPLRDLPRADLPTIPGIERLWARANPHMPGAGE